MKIAVIGGGVIGMSCALHLARYGMRTSLFTQTTLASGASAPLIILVKRLRPLARRVL